MGAITCATLLLLGLPLGAQNKTTADSERVGIYDSRAVAVAYAGSTWQVKKKRELTARLEAARATGDTALISQLEAEGRAWQSTLMQQGFGTAPVDDLLVHIAAELPGIWETAGVTDLVSKWDPVGMKRHPRAARVDVTMLLVDGFQPSETQRRRAIEIQKTKPQRIKE